jgi:hypothetical protein
MNIKTGILAAAAALTLAVPAAALAQPYYGDHGYGRYEYRHDRDDWRRAERQRERERREEWRRLRWEREHANRGYGYVSPYYR